MNTASTETANDRKNRLRREARAAAAEKEGKVLRSPPGVNKRKAARADRKKTLVAKITFNPKIKKGEPAYRRLMQLKFGLTRPATKAEMAAMFATAAANTAAMQGEG